MTSVRLQLFYHATPCPTHARGVSLGSLSWTQHQKAQSAKNAIVAPRIFDYQRPRGVDTPEEAHKWVARMAKRGVDGPDACLRMIPQHPATTRTPPNAKRLRPHVLRSSRYQLLFAGRQP